jgi:hypothetical protein
VPNNTFTSSILRPTIAALHKVRVQHESTKTIVWPSSPAELQAVADGFLTKYGLPGCVGAIDGSLIPQKKPKSAAAGGDADAYYGYKGFIASLLLAVVDSNKIFRYVHAGAPACLGDAGLFQRSALKKSIDNGCFRILDMPIRVAGQQRHINPYLVGDAAFGLTQFMQKNFAPPPDPGSAQAKFNKRLTDCRRRLEVAFGDLKGRWVVCKRNVFWNDVKLLSRVIAV